MVAGARRLRLGRKVPSGGTEPFPHEHKGTTIPNKDHTKSRAGLGEAKITDHDGREVLELRRMSRLLECPIDPSEIGSLGEQLAATQIELGELEDEAKTSAAGFRKRIGDKRGRMNEIARRMRDRRESRMVDCVVLADLAANEVRTYRGDSWDVEESRTMSPDEVARYRQGDLGLEDGDEDGDEAPEENCASCVHWSGSGQLDEGRCGLHGADSHAEQSCESHEPRAEALEVRDDTAAIEAGEAGPESEDG